MIIDELFEAPQQCPECGGISFSDLILAEKKDACYYKVKASAKVWPSAYASGRLVQCRKKGAANYGNKSEGVAEGESGMFSKVMGHETTPEAARQIQQQGFKKSHTGIFFNVGNQNYSGGGYGGTVVMAKVSGPIDDILNLEDDNDLPDNLDDFADGEEIANYAREEGYWAWTDGVQFAVLDPRHIQVVKQGVAEEQELDEKWSQKYKSSINCANPKGFSQKAHCAGRNKNESIAENAGQPLSVQQLATISDAALDDAYGYGRSTPGNTFGWQANLKSAAYAKQMIDQGVTDIEAISDAIHKGWNTTAQAFVQDPKQFDDTAKLAAAGKLEAKLQQRAQLMKQNYAQLPEEEKEKDRVVARALLQAIRGEQGMDESLGKQIHNTFQSMGDSFSDAHLAKGISYFLQGRHQEGENWLRGKIPQAAQDTVFSKLQTLQAQGGVDVNKNANVQQYIDDKLVPWVKNQIQQNIKETRRGQVPMTLKPGETDNIEPEDSEGFKKLPAYKQGQQAQQSRGKDLIQQSPYTYQSDQDWAYRNGAFDAQQAAASANFAKRGPLTTAEGEQQKGADYRDPKEVNYDDEYDAMVARVKKLAGLGPMRTVYDPNKRQYRNMPTAVQPKK
jgi:hypothetical protein